MRRPWIPSRARWQGCHGRWRRWSAEAGCWVMPSPRVLPPVPLVESRHHRERRSCACASAGAGSQRGGASDACSPPPPQGTPAAAWDVPACPGPQASAIAARPAVRVPYREAGGMVLRLR